jgi:RNA polymerase sigma-70 factor (ECF subfamily)
MHEIPDKSSPHHAFDTTQWTMVVQAGQHSSPESRRALSALCECYWYPLYAYVRRRGYQPAEAQDLTQAFFTELLEKDRLRLADQQRGRFRAFLLASLQNFVANQWRAAHAQKRGGQMPAVSLDLGSAESRYRFEPSTDWTPERIYERRWALTLLDRAMNRLRSEYETAGKLAVYERMKNHLAGGSQLPSYEHLASDLKMTEGSVKVAIHRMRKRCRELLRAEIGETVADPSEIDEELRSLFAALGP